MKFYIPSSSLNLNTFLATEMIHAVGEYRVRTFGSKHYMDVLPQEYDNCIYLYTSIPEFPLLTRDVGEKSAEVEFPIVFEVQVDISDKYLYRLGPTKYVLFRSIIASKDSVRILFFSEFGLTLTKVKSALVQEAKMFDKYDISIVPKPDNLISDEDAFDEDILNPFLLDKVSKNPFLDKAVNALKGALYAYMYRTGSSFEEAESFVKFLKGIAGDGVDTSNSTFYLTCIFVTLMQHLKPNPSYRYTNDDIFDILEDLTGLLSVRETFAKPCMLDVKSMVNYFNNPDPAKDLPVFNKSMSKALFIFLKKINKVEELLYWLNEKPFNKDYFAYVFYGLVVGFSGLSCLEINPTYVQAIPDDDYKQIDEAVQTFSALLETRPCYGPVLKKKAH